MNKGFASQVVFGIGSYTFQYNTRDTFGIAVKGTYVEIDGVGQDIFKDPITDDGTKKSAVGLLRVEKENGNYVLYDKQTIEQSNQGELKTVFLNGKLIKDWTLKEVRTNANG
jgi:nicotinamide phosphoribosyltransferase